MPILPPPSTHRDDDIDYMDIDDDQIPTITAELASFRTLETSQSPPCSSNISASQSQSISLPYTNLSTLTYAALIVLDTNLLISKLGFVSQLLELIESFGMALIIPWCVVQELDDIKSRKSHLGPLARSATSFLLNAFRADQDSQVAHLSLGGGTVTPSKIRGQQVSEFVETPERLLNNDDRILDCCRYFQQKLQSRGENRPGHTGTSASMGRRPGDVDDDRHSLTTALLTLDKNLALKAQIHGIRIYQEFTTPRDLLEDLSRTHSVLSSAPRSTHNGQSHNLSGPSQDSQSWSSHHHIVDDMEVEDTYSMGPSTIHHITRNTTVPPPKTIVLTPDHSNNCYHHNLGHDAATIPTRKTTHHPLSSILELLPSLLTPPLKEILQRPRTFPWYLTSPRKLPWSMSDLVIILERYWVSDFRQIYPPHVRDKVLKRIKDASSAQSRNINYVQHSTTDQLMQMIVDLQDLTGIIARTDPGFHSKVSNLLLSAKDAVLGRSRWDDIGLGIEALATEAMQRERTAITNTVEGETSGLHAQSGRGNGWDGEESQVSAAVSLRHDRSRSFPGSASDFPSHGSGNSSTRISRNLSSSKFLGAAVGRTESAHSPTIQNSSRGDHSMDQVVGSHPQVPRAGEGWDGYGWM